MVPLGHNELSCAALAKLLESFSDTDHGVACWNFGIMNLLRHVIFHQYVILTLVFYAALYQKSFSASLSLMEFLNDVKLRGFIRTHNKTVDSEIICFLGPLLLTWINFNPSMDK